jgi:hypothetical protein
MTINPEPETTSDQVGEAARQPHVTTYERVFALRRAAEPAEPEAEAG